jgi:DNA-binding MarR family transcriptional regulator
MAKSSPARHQYLDPDEYESWNALLMLNKVVLAELDAELRTKHRLSVVEFDVLITLYNAEGRRLRMTALGERVLLSPAGTTHLVTRLERDGLVSREVDPTDRRRWFTVLTDAGDETLRVARVTHNHVLRRSLFDVLSAPERRILQRVWRRLEATRPALAPVDT